MLNRGKLVVLTPFQIFALGRGIKRDGSRTSEGGGSAGMCNREVKENRGVVKGEAKIRPHIIILTGFTTRREASGLAKRAEERKEVIVPKCGGAPAKFPAREEVVRGEIFTAATGTRSRK